MGGRAAGGAGECGGGGLCTTESDSNPYSSLERAPSPPGSRQGSFEEHRIQADDFCNDTYRDNGYHDNGYHDNTYHDVSGHVESDAGRREPAMGGACGVRGQPRPSTELPHPGVTSEHCNNSWQRGDMRLASGNDQSRATYGTERR